MTEDEMAGWHRQLDGLEFECLTCLLRNLDEGQEATVRAGHGTTDWFQKGKGVYLKEY